MKIYILKMNRLWSKLKQKKLLLVLVLIILFGSFIRLYELTQVPSGYNQDEVSAAYEAFALSQNGTDRWGNAWPAYFLSWGSGQNVLLSYLDIPVFAIVGINPLSIRLIPVLLGILTLPLVFLITRKLFSSKTGLIATAILALTPWHIIASRWGLESNLLPFFFLLGIYTFTKALDDRGWIIPSLIPWVLAIYAYSVSLFFIPFILIALAICYSKKIKLNIKSWLLALVIFIIFTAPIFLMVLKNYIVKADLPIERFLPFTIPLFTTDRISQIPTGGLEPALAWDWKFFSSGFNDGSVLNSFRDYPGILPVYIMIFLLFLATNKLVKDKKARLKAMPLILSFLISFLIYFVLSLFTFLNINRVNALFLPLIIFCAYGFQQFLEFFHKHYERFLFLVISTFCVGIWLYFSLQFVFDYFNGYNNYSSWSNYSRLDEAIIAVSKMSKIPDENGREIPVYISTWPGLNYMFVLFYNRVSPVDFNNNAVITDRVSVQSYKNFYFNTDALPKSAQKIYFVEYGNPHNYCFKPLITDTFGDWKVGSCIRK